jgi:hypothetical protein
MCLFQQGKRSFASRSSYDRYEAAIFVNVTASTMPLAPAKFIRPHEPAYPVWQVKT